MASLSWSRRVILRLVSNTRVMANCELRRTLWKSHRRESAVLEPAFPAPRSRRCASLTPVQCRLQEAMVPPTSRVRNVTVASLHRSWNALQDDDESQELLQINGWIVSARHHGKLVFCDVMDGSRLTRPDAVSSEPQVNSVTGQQTVNVPGSAPALAQVMVVFKGASGNTPFKQHHIVRATGRIKRSVGPQQPFEFMAHTLEHLVPPFSEDTPGVNSATPVNVAMTPTTQGLTKTPHLRSALEKFVIINRIRNGLIDAVNSVLSTTDQPFIRITTPLITRSACEDASETFGLEHAVEYFSTPAHLTSSAQFHLEASLSPWQPRVYTLSPVFRADQSNSRFHLSEFWMLECEAAFVNDVDSLCDLIQSVLVKVVQEVKLNFSKDIARLVSRILHGPPGVESVISNPFPLIDVICKNEPFPRITYAEAAQALVNASLTPDCGKSGGQRRASLRRESTIDAEAVSSDFKLGDNFSKADETKLCELFGDGGAQPVFVTNFPAHLKPFYAARDDDTTLTVDLLFPRVGEVVGGSVREMSVTSMCDRLPDDNDSLKWYFDLRNGFLPPHAGFGIGIERLLLVLTGLARVHDVSAFPRSKKLISC